jgi:aspartyl-tRNA(Asn)/glutamyl-tRNA(Gln) amidotransferase subunit A
MARNVADAALMLDVMAGPDASDPHSLKVVAPRARDALAAPANLAGVKIAWRPFCGNTLLDPEIRALCERAGDVLREHGAEVRLDERPIDNAEPSWRILQQSNWAARWGGKLAEIESRIDPSFADGIRAAMAYSGQDLLQATYKRTLLFRTVQSWFREFQFVITPTMSRPALAVDHKALEPIEIDGKPAGDMRASWIPYLNLFDLTGHPAVSVPCGRTRGGLPAGLQIVGPWYADGEVLKIGRVLEEAIGWPAWVPPHAAA